MILPNSFFFPLTTSTHRGAIAIGFVSGAPDNAFCRLERGELTLSQVCGCGLCGRG